jgi:sugar phosphate permease
MLANPVTMTVASAVCLTLITYFNSHRVGRFEGWQMMFIIEGLPSIVWAFIWLRLADETPSDARWLSTQEAARVRAMLDKEQRAIPKMGNFLTAFVNPSVLLIAGMFMCLNAASYGMSMWLPVLVDKGSQLVYQSRMAVGLGLTLAATAGLLTTVPYFISIFTSLGVAWMSDRSLKRKRYVVGSMFVGSGAYVLAYIAVAYVHAPLESFLIAFLGLIIAGSAIYTPTAPNWAWLAEILPRNVVGESMALVNTFGALGGLLGTNLVGMLVAHLHSNNAAFVFLACAFGMAGVLGSLVRSAPRPEPRGFEVLPTAAAEA